MTYLRDEPVDYQLTVHYHNYNNHRDFIKDFDICTKYYLQFNQLPEHKMYAAMSNFILTYGVAAIDNFLTEFSMRRSA